MHMVVIKSQSPRLALGADTTDLHTFLRHASLTRSPQLTDGAGLDKVIIIENCPLFKASAFEAVLLEKPGAVLSSGLHFMEAS